MNHFKFSDYDCIGFDLDSTIIQYKIKNLLLLIYDVTANYLIEKKGYDPKYLKKPLTVREFDFLQKGLFFDFQRGNILKLTPEGNVHLASHGTKMMNKAEIEKYYPNREWEISKIFSKDPLITWNGPLSLKIRTVLDVFDTPAVLIFARVVDTLDEKNGKPLNDYNIWPDILDAFVFIYSRENLQNNTGHFFSALQENPDKYINKSNEKVLTWIRNLKENNKKTFLITGSNSDFVEVTTNYALGKEWKSLFDIIVCYAKKPAFFTEKRPFYSLKNYYENKIVTNEEFQLGETYNQGNWQELVKFFCNITGASSPKCLYVGDNLLQDIYAPNDKAQCDTVAISVEHLVEGMLNHDFYHIDKDIINSNVWGSFFTLQDSNGYKDSFWNNIIKKNSKICIPDLEVVVDKYLDEPIECFTQENNDKALNGYYPAKPTTTSSLQL
ncbi:5'-nucleotidase domain-containing protein 1 [Phymastichus coffea]|uniref:5'-nucleotidase domain-containing protein 1 n=1 Tax=Phymastichus coffea TaxID=108790 RepID=UPI00273CC7D4|nr:5'-nucleotidase domain-containing protein 1 [Phymastichus coffea]